MRKSYDGLIALAKNHLQADPVSGDGFIFINKRRTMMKCLYFEPGGFCLWSKRLEQGQFASLGEAGCDKVALNATTFAALIEGMDIEVKRHRKRYKKAA